MVGVLFQKEFLESSFDTHKNVAYKHTNNTYEAYTHVYTHKDLWDGFARTAQDSSWLWM